MAKNIKSSLGKGPKADTTNIDWNEIGHLLGITISDGLRRMLIELMDDMSQRLRAEPFDISQKALDQLNEYHYGPRVPLEREGKIVPGRYEPRLKNTNNILPDDINEPVGFGLNERQYVIFMLLRFLRFHTGLVTKGPSATNGLVTALNDQQNALLVLVTATYPERDVDPNTFMNSHNVAKKLLRDHWPEDLF